MLQMFVEASSFNSDLSSWNVSNVTNMLGMFYKASSFNSDLSSWDISKVTDMTSMFEDATSFNQDLGAWDVSKVSKMDNILSNTSLSTENYDALLKGWSKLQLVKNISFSAGDTHYCNSEVERQYIIDNFGWRITDAGKDCPSLGEESLILSKGLSIYPNPTSETVFITTETPLVKVEIYSTQGTKVKELKSNLNAIPVGELDNGVYFLRIYSDKGVAVKKFVKR